MGVIAFAEKIMIFPMKIMLNANTPNGMAMKFQNPVFINSPPSLPFGRVPLFNHVNLLRHDHELLLGGTSCKKLRTLRTAGIERESSRNLFKFKILVKEILKKHWSGTILCGSRERTLSTTTSLFGTWEDGLANYSYSSWLERFLNIFCQLSFYQSMSIPLALEVGNKTLGTSNDWLRLAMMIFNSCRTVTEIPPPSRKNTPHPQIPPNQPICR